MADPQPVSRQSDPRLRVPRPLIGLLARPRVVALLDDAVRQHRLTLVSGGPGAGKTLAVAAWSREGHPPGPVAWVSIDASLRVPERLWKAVLRALRQALGEDAFGGLVVPSEIDADFIEEFAARCDGTEACLVLDDAHELDAGAGWEGIDHLLRVAPPSLRLVLVSRHDPPLALQRHRLAGELGDVRALDLAFTDEEVHRLLALRQWSLPEPVVRVLVETTEGWPAGLRLALITAEAAADPLAALQAFNGRQELVAGYLVEEVIRGLGREGEDFLLRTAVADRVSGPLAQALTGHPAPERMLRELAGVNALVLELKDSGWYRYHPLLLEMLRARLRAEHGELERELHRRAAQWYEGGGDWLAALDHAVDSQDWDLAAGTALGSATALTYTSERAALGAALARVPRHLAHDRPDLSVALALGALCRQDPDAETALYRDAAPRLATLEEPRRSLAALNLHMLEAARARRAGDAVAMVAAARAALAASDAVTTAQAPGWNMLRGTALGLRAIGELWSGNPLRSAALLRDSLGHAPGPDIEAYGLVYHQGHYALTLVASGQTAGARAIAGRCLAVAERSGTTLRHSAGAAHLALSTAEVQRGDLAAAGRALSDGMLAAGRGRDPFIAAGLRAVAAQRALLAGDLAGARRLLAEVQAALAAHPGMVLIERLHAWLGVEVALAAGLPASAEALLAGHAVGQGHPGEPDPLALARARVHLARGRAEEARAAVASQLHAAGTVGAEAWTVTALAADRLRQDAAAIEALAHAVALAAAEDAGAALLRPGDRLPRLLTRHLEVVGEDAGFVQRILATEPGPGESVDPGETLEPLTDREASVLAYLPTMASNAEIASGLGISVNTVKQHLKSMNRKLAVSSRRDAVRVARARGLLR